MSLPTSVTREAWEAAREAHLLKVKALTRQQDALAAERRRLPRLKIEKDYTFDGTAGKVRFVDLFEGRRQLILYHFMFAPDVGGWPEAGCPGCSKFLDQVGHLAHLHARDVTFALVSLAPLPQLLAYRARMGWTAPWYSSAGTDFNRDFGTTTDEGETFRLSVFLREGDDIFYTYYTNGRGVGEVGTVWSLLDLTPFGRQETWEDSPPGTPQSAPYEWWRRHDEYGRD